MSRKKEEAARKEKLQKQISRIKLPRGKQVFGIVSQRVGGSRMKVKCLDGNERLCRIPGRMKRYLWVREGDIVIVEPWELGGEEKGDIIYKYTKSQVQYLKRKGHLKKMENVKEF